MNCVLWPVILYFFFEVPLYSVMLNLLVIPLMPVILSCGMAGSLVRMAGGNIWNMDIDGVQPDIKNSMTDVVCCS